MLSTTRDGRGSPGVRGMKCNMVIGKTVGEVYSNYTIESVEFAGYLL